MVAGLPSILHATSGSALPQPESRIFIDPNLREVSIGNFHRKAPKWVKNQAIESKILKIKTKQQIPANSYCRNPLIPNWRIPTVAVGLPFDLVVYQLWGFLPMPIETSLNKGLLK